jgi:hypothetical protein
VGPALCNLLLRAVPSCESQFDNVVLDGFEAGTAESEGGDQRLECNAAGSGALRSCGFETSLRHVCSCVSLHPFISSNTGGKSPVGPRVPLDEMKRSYTEPNGDAP